MRRTITVLLSIAMVFAAAACSNEPEAPSAADTTFVQEMAASASATMAMADLARNRTDDPDVRALAADVFEKVAPVVDQLAELGPQLAADGAKGFAHEDSENHDEASASRFDELSATTDRKFDATFVAVLTEELRAGQAMAQSAQNAVTDPRTQALSDATAITWSELLAQAENK